MQIIKTIADLRTARASLSGSVGVVLTMGALHEGHLSLVQRAASANDAVIATIFVNPSQFNDPKDLAAYPRDLEGDAAMLRQAGVTLLFAPASEDMYPAGYHTHVMVDALTERLEGERRPGHFQGVTTVVSKLFNLTQPDKVYFGQKDAQQVIVIQQMVRDLNFPLEVIVCPTMRAADGLALSSRNQNLSAEERRAAPVLNRALQMAKDAFDQGERQAETLREIVHSELRQEALARVDYVSVANADNLRELAGPIETPALLSLAVFIGQIRLIDNIILAV